VGGNAGIKGAVKAIVEAEVKDADIASFFFFQSSKNGGPADGHPSVAAIEECLVLQLGEVSGGPEKYSNAKTTDGHTCRDMKTAHTGFNISDKTFDKFVTIAAGVLKTAGVADADIATIGTVLNGTKKDISSANGVDKFTPPKN
jgi:hypothetical protein